MAIIDPSLIRGVLVWRGLHSRDDEDEDYTLGGGIIHVQAEIIRFVEELGLYPGGRRQLSDASTVVPVVEGVKEGVGRVQTEEEGRVGRVETGQGRMGRVGTGGEERQRIGRLQAVREVKRQI